MRQCELRASAFHGVVSTRRSNAESFGFGNPETTPLSIPTSPATAPVFGPDPVSDRLILSVEERSGFSVSPLIDIIIVGGWAEDETFDRVTVVVNEEDDRLQSPTQDRGQFLRRHLKGAVPNKQQLAAPRGREQCA